MSSKKILCNCRLLETKDKIKDKHYGQLHICVKPPARRIVVGTRLRQQISEILHMKRNLHKITKSRQNYWNWIFTILEAEMPALSAVLISMLVEVYFQQLISSTTLGIIGSFGSQFFSYVCIFRFLWYFRNSSARF